MALRDFGGTAAPVNYRALVVGDVLPAGADERRLFEPGPSRWFALRVAPQSEDKAEAWLRLRGVYGFHPVLIRTSRRMGTVREYQRRYLPGYVFARFKGEPITHRILACQFITGALCRQDGAWGVLEPERLQAIHAMRAVDVAALEARQAAEQRRRQALAPRKGGLAIFRAGPFEGIECQVVDLRADGGVTVRLSVYGRDIPVQAHADALEAVSKGR